jgi:hypothetical protein
VSFFGFMLLGPAILIMLRVYLQIYVEHCDRLDPLARSLLSGYWRATRMMSSGRDHQRGPQTRIAQGGL